jgi:hypothetical protein
MTPYLNNGEVVHSVSALTLAVMQDIGWETSATPSPTASPTSTPTSAPTPTPTATLPIVDIGLPALTKNTTVAVSMTETDPAGTGIAGWFLSSISATPAVGDPGWQAVEPTTFALPAGDGVKTVYAWVKNNAGTISAADSATTTLDTTAPVIFLPVPHIVEGQTLGTSALIHVSWTAALESNGVSAYQLQVRRGTQAWTPISLASPASTSVDVTLAVGASYRFRLAATDTAGNTSGTVTTSSSKLSLAQEKATTITYAGSWKRVSLSGSSGGYVKRSLTGGNTATHTFNGRDISFVSTRGPARGIAQVRVDGNLVATIDLYSATSQTKRVVWSSTVSPGSHTVEIRVTGTRNAASSSNRIDIDAYLRWT